MNNKLRSLFLGTLTMCCSVTWPLLVQAAPKPQPEIKSHTFSEAIYLDKKPEIDGNMDAVWEKAPWIAMDQLMKGVAVDAKDFRGRFKLGWRKEGLYVIAEIVDDKLVDQYADPLVQYWDDDTLEIFVDEDQSGGAHKQSYNAFAYHVALDNQNVDIDDEGIPRLLNDHVNSHWRRHDNVVIWEVYVKIFDDTFDHRKEKNVPVKLHAGKKMGFMLAYCDNDNSPVRESFYGSTFIEGEDKDQGWLNAGVFTPITLVKKK